MIEFYRKYRKIFVGLFVLNIVLAILQAGYAYRHLNKHEYGWAALSLFFVGIAVWQGIVQYNNWRDVIQKEKDYMWRQLSAPSEVLR